MSLETVFKTILTASILGSILVVFISLVSTTFKKILSPSFKYYIWLLLLIKLVYPFGPVNNLNIFTAVSKIQSAVITTNKSDNLLLIPGRINQALVSADKEGVTKLSSEVDKSLINTNAIKRQVNYVQTFSRIWIAGVFIISLYIFIGLTKVNKIKKNKSCIQHIDRSVINECCKIVGIKREIGIAFTDKVDTPSIVGVFKPIILMPSNILNILSIDKFKFVVLHELVHYKRKDIYLNLIIIALGCFYWFNPVIIYGLYKMKQCREISCDAFVLTLLESDARLEYGYTIIELAEKSISNRLIPNNGLNFIIKSDLKRRVSMIKGYKKMSKYSILAGFIIVLVVGILGLSNTSAKDQQKSVNSTVVDEIYKEKINASNKFEFWNRVESKVNEDIINSLSFNQNEYTIVRLEDMPLFTVGRFNRFNDYKFCQNVTQQVSNAVSFPIGSFKHILLINNNEKEIYFAYKEPAGNNVAVRFELNKEAWEESKTIKAEGEKLEFIEYQLLQEI